MSKQNLCDCETGKPVENPCKRAKRAPSKYNLFLSECIKERKKGFTECVGLWRKEKDSFVPK